MYWAGLEAKSSFSQLFNGPYFSVSDFLNLPFQQRYDLAVVMLDTAETEHLSEQIMSQILVKLRDLFAKRLVVISRLQDEKLLRALGFTQLIDKTTHEADFALWQFNILTYKHVPDWFNSKFWANPGKLGINFAGKPKTCLNKIANINTILPRQYVGRPYSCN